MPRLIGSSSIGHRQQAPLLGRDKSTPRAASHHRVDRQRRDCDRHRQKATNTPALTAERSVVLRAMAAVSPAAAQGTVPQAPRFTRKDAGLDRLEPDRGAGPSETLEALLRQERDGFAEAGMSRPASKRRVFRATRGTGVGHRAAARTGVSEEATIRGTNG